MRIVFDLDDTVSVHKNRDYENAAPIENTIEKIRKLKSYGAEIIIYTARGQNSCKGNLQLIEAKNRGQIERWLKKHDVPFDELVFGKPLGDVYVDDKGVSLEEFINGKYEPMVGNSGAEVFRAGNRVIKRGENVRAQADWYREARSLGLSVPNVHSAVLDSIDVDFIEGCPGYKRTLSKKDLYDLIANVMRLSVKKTGYTFNTQALSRRIKEHLSSCESPYRFERLFEYMESNAEQLAIQASFCHGDMSLSNTIFNADGIYLIDPICGTEYSSYLMDLAKLRFSLDGGENFLHEENRIDYSRELSEYDLILQENGWAEQTRALETSYWIRLLKYTESNRRKMSILEKAEELQETI